MKLFDWTMRNVWFDGNPKDIEKLPLNPLLPLVMKGWDTQLPWNTLIRGRGDYLARSRVFLIGFSARDSGGLVGIARDHIRSIQAVVDGSPVGDQIYLFDPRLAFHCRARAERGCHPSRCTQGRNGAAKGEGGRFVRLSCLERRPCQCIPRARHGTIRA